MMDWIAENWAVIVPLAGAVVALFFPQFKPFVDALIKRPTLNPKPQPGPDGIIPDPDPDEDLISVVLAIQQLIDHFRRQNNPEAERLARQTAKQLFEPVKSPIQQDISE